VAKLKAKTRNALPGSDFAVPGRRYPVNDASHARNALARVAQHGSPKEKAEVRAKVHEKFPGIGGGGRGMKKETKKPGMKKPSASERGGGGMMKHMGERGDHDATGAHEGRCMGMDCK
jgi:hypothetical protein